MKNLIRNARLFALAAAIAGAASLASAADAYVFKIKNTLGFNRTDEVVEAALPEGLTATGKCLTDAAGRPVPFEATARGTILFRASVAKGEVAEYALADGTNAAPAKATYAAIKAPGSRDDIAWENDLAAYRMYSMTLLKSEPNTGNGIDLWQKKMAEPVIDKMYALSNYHSESAYGVDAYSVNGRRLGCGAVSHVVDGKVITHDPHNSCTVDANGLLRSAFTVTYENVSVGGAAFTKTVKVETTAGALLNKATVRYDGPSTAPIRLAVALYMHTDMSGDYESNTFTSVPGLIGLAEKPSEGTVTSPNPRFFAGAYVPGVATEAAILNDHLVLAFDYTPGTDLVYYFGGGWNAWPVDAYPTDDDWFDALVRFRKQTDAPLAVTSASTIPAREDVITLIHNVNRHWQETNPTHGDYFWNRAVYHTGNMAAYAATGEEDYRAFSEAWAVRNNWSGSTGTDKSRWKYSYGEGADYVLFGDNQICFQIYADLYKLDDVPDPKKIARAIEVMEYQMSTSNVDYWWWVDGLYMVMPVMTKLNTITGNELYLSKMYDYWKYATDLMYDPEEGLYYRDGGYVFPGWSIKVGDDPTPKKDFWARGCGWIFAAFGRVLADLPASDPHRAEYIKIYKEMAVALKKAQQPEGHWTRSILEPNYATGYETSGTALFVAGYLWGINNGIFSDEEYGETVERAWNYLTTIALQPDNSVGYVQPIGSKAEPGVVISAGQTADFGTGAFLLAAAEMLNYAAGDADVNALRLSTAKLEGSNRIVCTFNEAPEAAGIIAANFLLNGAPADAKVESDGDRKVTLSFSRPLAYGLYQLEVKGLQSINGGALAPDQKRTLVRAVPLSPSPAYVTVTAIGAQSGNPATNTIDNNMGTRWSQAGIGQWIQFDLAEVRPVIGVDLAFYAGTQRRSFFDVQVSTDGANFTTVLEGCQSSGLTNDLERFAFNNIMNARYVRVICNGNSQGGDNWNSITEARIPVEMAASELGDVDFPAAVYFDMLMPGATSTGLPIDWISSDPQILSESGIVNAGDADATVTLGAFFGTSSKEFTVLVPARNPDAAMLVRYDFEAADIDGTKVKDLSGRGNDATLMGSAKVTGGKLDLTDNIATFSANGYALAPAGVLDSLRSFTFMIDAKAEHLEKQPRLWDFGSGSGNSVFVRANAFAAGLKYNGGNTTLIAAPEPLAVGREQHVAVTFSAATGVTTVYVDGVKAVESTAIATEPYMLARIAKDSRNYLGRTQWWDTSASADNRDFCGTLDNFRLYAMALTAEEIAAAAGVQGIEAVEAEAEQPLLSSSVAERGSTITVASAAPVAVYTASGALAATAPGNATRKASGTSVGNEAFTTLRIDLPAGLYIVRAGSRSAKLLVK